MSTVVIYSDIITFQSINIVDIKLWIGNRLFSLIEITKKLVYIQKFIAQTVGKKTTKINNTSNHDNMCLLYIFVTFKF